MHLEIPVWVTFRSDGFLAFPPDAEIDLNVEDLFVDSPQRLFYRFETASMQEASLSHSTNTLSSGPPLNTSVSRQWVARGNQLSFRFVASGAFSRQMDGVLDGSGELIFAPADRPQPNYSGFPQLGPTGFSEGFFDAMINEGR